MSADRHSDESFERRARALLQESAEQLDGRTRSRLTQARHAALDALAKRSTKVQWWLPAGSVAAAAVLTLLLTLKPMPREYALTPAEEIELLAAEESLEFYRDVEFYAWLDTVLPVEPAEDGGA